MADLYLHMLGQNCSAARLTHHSLLAVLREGKNGVSIFVVQVVKEDSAAPSALIAVLDQEVVITPLLELGEVLWIILVTHSLPHR